MSYNMQVSEAEFSQANDWWRNLSINQMKALQKKYEPHWQQLPHKRMIHQWWELEGKPAPQEVIPVLPQFM